MTNDVNELLKIKEHVDKAARERLNLEGQLAQVQKRIKDDFACNSAEEAQRYVEELAAQAAALEKEISEGVAELKEELGW